MKKQRFRPVELWINAKREVLTQQGVKRIRRERERNPNWFREQP